jgi:hypothetical protein
MGEAKRRKLAPCICGTGLPAGQCCWTSHGYHKRPAVVDLHNKTHSFDHLVGGGEERFFAAVPCLVVSVRSAAATVSPALAAFTCPCRRRLT